MMDFRESMGCGEGDESMGCGEGDESLRVNENIQSRQNHGVRGEEAVQAIIGNIIRRHKNPAVPDETRENHKTELGFLQLKYPDVCNAPEFKAEIGKILNVE